MAQVGAPRAQIRIDGPKKSTLYRNGGMNMTTPSLVTTVLPGPMRRHGRGRHDQLLIAAVVACPPNDLVFSGGRAAPVRCNTRLDGAPATYPSFHTGRLLTEKVDERSGSAIARGATTIAGLCSIDANAPKAGSTCRQIAPITNRRAVCAREVYDLGISGVDHKYLRIVCWPHQVVYPIEESELDGSSRQTVVLKGPMERRRSDREACSRGLAGASHRAAAIFTTCGRLTGVTRPVTAHRSGAT